MTANASIWGRPPLDNVSLLLPQSLPAPPLLTDVAEEGEAEDEDHEDGPQAARSQQAQHRHQLVRGPEGCRVEVSRDEDRRTEDLLVFWLIGLSADVGKLGLTGCAARGLTDMALLDYDK